MKVKEEKICSFSQEGKRLQLVKVITDGIYMPSGNIVPIIKYQVRLNRKIIDSNESEFCMRKTFAIYCQNIVLQLKIF